MNATLATLAMCTYLASTLLIARDTKQNKRQHTPVYLAWIAVCAHALYITIALGQNNSFNFSFIGTASLVSLIVALLLLIATINKPVEKLGIVIFPIAGLMLGLDLNLPEKPHLLHAHNWQMSTHILTSIVAFSLLNIAALQAILLAIQDQQLKSHPPKRLAQSLPPLQTMETLLFQMIGIGLFFS